MKMFSKSIFSKRTKMPKKPSVNTRDILLSTFEDFLKNEAYKCQLRLEGKKLEYKTERLKRIVENLLEDFDNKNEETMLKIDKMFEYALVLLESENLSEEKEKMLMEVIEAFLEENLLKPLD